MTAAKVYRRDDSSGVYVSSDSAEIAYSDGWDVEARIAATLDSICDRSVFSEEIAGLAMDWPLQYHLDRRRHAILRPLGIGETDRVLELGCGCGAVTRYLGETGAEVVAVEGTMARAICAAARCRDLPNVSVYVDNFLQFEDERGFDYVLLIGVLEYSKRYSLSADPGIDYLEKAKSLLRPAGRLVVAIENALGLKYFNWCYEDHLPSKFVALNGRYDQEDVTTYGKKELSSLLSQCGFNQQSFYYPFPDYKLATDLVSESGACDPCFDAGALAARTLARDYRGAELRLFSEIGAWRLAARNGILGDLSNSLMVVATREGGWAVNPADLAWSFSFERRTRYCVVTRFVKRHDMLVEKVRVAATDFDPPESRHFGHLHHRVSVERYHAGVPLSAKLDAAAQHPQSATFLVEVLGAWVRKLQSFSTCDGESSQLSSYLLPGEYIDATPGNALVAGGEIQFFDFEWKSDHRVPLGWVITRGLRNALSQRPVAHWIHRSTLERILAECLSQLGLFFSADDLACWADWEAELSSITRGVDITRFADGGHVFNQLDTKHLVEDAMSEYLYYIGELRTKISNAKLNLSD